LPYDDDRFATILQAGVTSHHPRRAMNPAASQISSDQGDDDAAAVPQDGSMSTERRSVKAATAARTPLWVWLILALWMLLVPAFLLISLGPPPWR
jgi:hypothetical protein